MHATGNPPNLAAALLLRLSKAGARRLPSTMAIPVARVHLKVAHAALPPLLPTPPKWNMLPLLLPPQPCVAAAKLTKPPPAKPGRADSGERWDAHKAKPAGLASSASPPSSGPRSPDSFTSRAGHRSPPRKNATPPPPPSLMPGRADSVERWDAHKAAGIPASSSSSPGTSSSLASGSKWPISKRRSPPRDDQRLDDGDGESSSTGSDGIDYEEEEILWKPRAMYAGPGFAVAAPKSSMLSMPTAFLVPAA